MNNATRRSFLGGLLTIGAASVVVPTSSLLAAPPCIVGDGIHDDWAGLQAAVNDKAFSLERDITITRTAGLFALTGGSFRLSRGLDLSASNYSYVSDCTFTATKDFKGDYMIKMGNHAVVSNCTMVGQRGRK